MNEKYIEWIKKVIKINFDGKIGAEYWIRVGKKLNFNLIDINDLTDLRLFGFFNPDILRDYPLEIFIPKIFLRNKSELIVGSSGGRTGKPKWVVYGKETYEYSIELLNSLMDKKRIPRDLNFLYIGPSGPHLFGKRVFDLCRRRNGLFYTIDLDPRWVRKLKGTEREKYISHILDQAIDIIRTQEVGVLFTTPIILSRLAKEEEIVNSEIRAIGLSGTPITPEDYSLFAEIFSDKIIFGYYGNALFGVCPEALVVDKKIVYQPPEPYVFFEVRDIINLEKRVEIGQEGRILGHRISPELFIPNFLETDIATRFKSEGCSDWIMNPKNIASEGEYGVY